VTKGWKNKNMEKIPLFVKWVLAKLDVLERKFLFEKSVLSKGKKDIIR